MRSSPGTYAVVWHCVSSATVTVGRWGRLDLVPGYYTYVGSAFGPGGVRARVNRHFRRLKPTRWHIDYLRDYLRPVGVWYTHDPRRLEHCWAGAFSVMSALTSIPGFGCSDCNCNSHLFFAAVEPPGVQTCRPFPLNDESAASTKIAFSPYSENPDND